MASVKGAICAIRMQNFIDESDWALHAATAKQTGPDGAVLHRTNLGSARPTLPRARSVSSLLNQQAFCLEPQLEVDDGFYRTPLVPGCFKALQYILPCALVGAQCYLPNELNSFGCAA
jgi:hypothetical protein